MSKKTIFKRIALTAVSALAAGSLAVISVPAATAGNNPAVGTTTNVAAADGILNVATWASITGDAVLSGTVGNANLNRSVGLLANSTVLTTSSLSSTVTMRADGEVVFYYQGSANGTAATVVVTGGTITDSVASTTGNTSSLRDINASRTQMAVTSAGINGAVDKAIAVFAFTPSSGSTSGTVEVYETATAVNTAAGLADIQSGAASKGTLKQRYTITVAAASQSGTYSAANSSIQGKTSANVANAATSNTDESGSLTITSQTDARAYIAVDLRDPYNVSLDGVGALVITATNGAGVRWSDTNAATVPVNLTAVANDTSGTITIARPSAFANKAFSTTVTITWNGTVVGTRTVNFHGEVAKITAKTVAYNAQAGSGNGINTLFGTLLYEDDKGNVLYGMTGTLVDALTTNTRVTTADVSDYPDTATADTTGDFGVACGGTTASGASSGSADLVFTHVNPASGTTIRSNAVKVTCSGNAATYTASFDKASYAPGEIATLTITAKDAAGNLANGYENIQAAGTSKIAITATQMTEVRALDATTERLRDGAGTLVLKFTVGATEGSYNAIVSVPVINAKDLGGANQTVAYKIANATSSVTNAEVLAAIVKLIASINKQIRALQKSLRR